MTITLTREEAQHVLDALETSAFHFQNHCDVGVDEQLDTIKKTQLQAETLRARLAQPEPPCKTGSQCIGGKCPQCVVDESEPVAVVASLNESAQEALLSEGHTLMAPLYTAPPQRKWQGLTDEGEILELSKDAWGRDRLKQGRADHTGFYVDFARAIEAKLKEKNT